MGKRKCLRPLLLSVLALFTALALTVGGFLVSDNVSAQARVLDVGFAFSDHNPVELEFTLMP